jgi:hypothetical protein
MSARVSKGGLVSAVSRQDNSGEPVSNHAIFVYLLLPAVLDHATKSCKSRARSVLAPSSHIMESDGNAESRDSHTRRETTLPSGADHSRLRFQLSDIRPQTSCSPQYSVARSPLLIDNVVDPLSQVLDDSLWTRCDM